MIVVVIRDRDHAAGGVASEVTYVCIVPWAEPQPGVPLDDGRGGDRAPRGQAGRLNVVQRADAERRVDVLAG